MVSAIIFDLDGTLTNTLQDIADAMNRSLRLHGLPEFDTDAYRYLVGDGAVKLAERAVRDRLDLADSVLREYQAYYEQHALEKSRPYDDMPQTLNALQALGIPLCVLSNKPHADTVNVVRWFFPQIEWSVIRGQLPGVPVKPDPTAALAIADALCVSPDSCLYVGDTSVDMRTAVSAGMIPVGVLWGFRDAKELTGTGARHLISLPEELVVLAQSEHDRTLKAPARQGGTDDDHNLLGR